MQPPCSTPQRTCLGCVKLNRKKGSPLMFHALKCAVSQFKMNRLHSHRAPYLTVVLYVALMKHIAIMDPKRAKGIHKSIFTQIVDYVNSCYTFSEANHGPTDFSYEHSWILVKYSL